jgi:hypothetical protein
MSIVLSGLSVLKNINGDGLQLRKNVKFSTSNDISATFAIATSGVPSRFTGAPSSNVDGTQTLVSGDRILVKNQTLPIQNGIYTVEDTTTVWHRSEDFDNSNVSGTIVTCTNGSSNGGISFLCISPDGSGAIDTDSIIFDPYLRASGTQTLTNKTFGDELKMGGNSITGVGTDITFAGDGNINVPTGQTLALQVNNIDVVNISGSTLTMATSTTLDMNNNPITNIPAPTNSGDAVNKGYADNLAAGLSVKESVRLATTVSIGTYSPSGGVESNGQITGTPSVVDGVTVVTGDRILVKDHVAKEITSLVAVAQSSLSDDGYFSVSDTTGQYNFVFDYGNDGFAASGAGGTDVAVPLSAAGDTDQDVADAIVLAVNGSAITATASTVGTSVSITSDNFGPSSGTPTDATSVLSLEVLFNGDGSNGSTANGLYVSTAMSTTWDRSPDFDSNAEFKASSFVFVEEGTSNDNSGYVVSSDNDITINTTPIQWTQFAGAGSITAGDGLNQIGNVFDLDIKSNSGLQITSGELDTNIKSNGGIVLETGQLSVDLSASSITGTLSETDGGTGLSAYTTGDILYASGANTLDVLSAGANTDVLTLAAGVPSWSSASTLATVLSAGNTTGGSDIVISNVGDTLNFLRTNTLTIDAASMGSNNTVTLPDPTSNDSFVYENLSQTLTNKTISSNTNNVISRELWVGSGASSVSTYAAVAPVSGQVLRATGTSTATWQDSSDSAKKSVKASSNGAGTLATSFVNGATIDGVVLVTGDRILIKNQTSGVDNGIYIVTAGAPTRSSDLPTGSNAAGVSVFVEEGTVNADTGFLITNNSGSDLVGTNALVFNTTVRSYIMVQANQVSVSSKSQGDIAFFNWDSSIYNLYSNIKCSWYCDDLANRVATIEIYDETTTTSLGTDSTSGTVPEWNSFTFSKPVGNAKISVKVNKDANGGTDPQIYGIQFILA